MSDRCQVPWTASIAAWKADRAVNVLYHSTVFPWQWALVRCPAPTRQHPDGMGGARSSWVGLGSARAAWTWSAPSQKNPVSLLPGNPASLLQAHKLSAENKTPFLILQCALPQACWREHPRKSGVCHQTSWLVCVRPASPQDTCCQPPRDPIRGTCRSLPGVSFFSVVASDQVSFRASVTTAETFQPSQCSWNSLKPRQGQGRRWDPGRFSGPHL